MNIKKLILTALSAMLISGAAFAGSYDHFNNSASQMGFYTGLQMGFASMGYKKDYWKTTIGLGTVGSAKSVTKNGFAGRFYLGFDFDQYVGLEMGYLWLPTVKFKKIPVTVAGVTATENESSSRGALDFLIKGVLPLSNGFKAYVKAGAARAIVGNFKFNATVNGQTVSKDYSGGSAWVPVAGLGVSYNITDNLFADVDYMYYGKNGHVIPSTHFAALGVGYKF